MRTFLEALHHRAFYEDGFGWSHWRSRCGSYELFTNGTSYICRHIDGRDNCNLRRAVRSGSLLEAAA